MRGGDFFLFPPPLRQGYRICLMMESRKVSSHPARLILRRMEALSGLLRRRLRASFRTRAMFWGPWSLRLRARSSSNTTSRTHGVGSRCPVACGDREEPFGEKALESRKYRTTGGSWVLPARRLSSTRPTALMPGKPCFLARAAAETTLARRSSTRPWLGSRTSSIWWRDRFQKCRRIGKQRRLVLLEGEHVLRLAIEDALCHRGMAMQRIGGDHTALERQQLEHFQRARHFVAVGRHALGDRKPGIRRQTLTRCSGVVLRPRSKAPRSALPSTETTPLICWAKAAMNSRNAASKANGSRMRNTRLNVSWLGIPCSSPRNCRSNPSFATPKSAMSAQPSAPHSTAAKAMTRISVRSCRAFPAPRVRQLLENPRELLHPTPPRKWEPSSESISATDAIPISSPYAIPLPSRGEGGWRVSPIEKQSTSPPQIQREVLGHLFVLDAVVRCAA